MPTPLERYPHVVALRIRSAGARDSVENTLSGRARRKSAGCAHIAQNADQGRVLRGEGHHDLGLQGTTVESIHDILLDLRGGTAFGPNSISVGDGDVALLVDRLVRNGDEVAGTDPRFGGEETAGGGLKDGHADNVAYSETERLGRSPVSECRRQS